jgi:hypothetical protein
MSSPCCLCPSLTNFGVCICCHGNVFTEPLSSNRSTSKPIKRRAILHSKAVERSVFYAVCVVSNTHVYSERKIGPLDTGFLGFPLSLSKC